MDIENGNVDTAKGGGWWDELREWDGRIYTTMCKTDS